MGVVPVTGGDIVAEWKERLPLETQLQGLVDRRTSNALRKRVIVLQESKDPDAFRLKNYLRLVDLAGQLCPPQVNSLSNPEVCAVVQQLESEGVEWPVVTRRNLLHRRVRDLCEAQDWLGFMHTIHPQGDSAFAPQTPTLSAVGEEARAKSELLQLYLIKNAMLKMIGMGEAGQSQLLDVTVKALCMFALVDFVELEPPLAVVVDQSACICRCLSALLTPTLDVSLLVASQGASEGNLGKLWEKSRL